MAVVQGDNSDNHGWHKVSSHSVASQGLSRFIFTFVLQRYFPLSPVEKQAEGGLEGHSRL